MDTELSSQLDGIRQHGLVVLAGAGISMLPPTSLPGWRDFNQAVLTAICARVSRDTNPQFVDARLKTILSRRESERAYAPDFMAQLMEEEIGSDYFRVLQALDSDIINLNHAAIAALARAGVVRAIVTTNFDRLLERALTAAGVDHRVYASTDDFAALSTTPSPGAPLAVIKAHGTVDRPETMVDTLAQRVAGRPEALNDAIRHLIDRHVCLTLGFSGADLDYDPDYLGLRRAADTACALRVLVRTGEAPPPALQSLVDACGERARVVMGSLPGVLTELARALEVNVPDAGSDGGNDGGAVDGGDWLARLTSHATAWVERLGPMRALTMFVALVDANGDDPWMIDFLLYFRRYYRTETHTVDPVHGSPDYWRYEYQFGRRLLDRGRHTPSQHDRDNGQRLLSSEVISFRSHEDALNMLGNASTRGKRLDAEIAMCELVFWVYGPGRALAFAAGTWQHVVESHDRRLGVDAMISISRVHEWSGEYTLALGASSAGIADARTLGDEPRRAACLVQHARALACVSRFDEAEACLADAGRIVDRLSLVLLGHDARAARGMLDVLRSRDRDAVAPLTEACAHYQRAGYLPRLFITLLDLARAAYYAGEASTLERAQRELNALSDLFPHVEGLVALLKSELSRDSEAWDLLATVTEELERFATLDLEYPWKWALTRVERNRAKLKELAG